MNNKSEKANKIDMIENRVYGEISSDITRGDKKAGSSKNEMIGLVQERIKIEVGRLEDVLANEVGEVLVIVRRSWRKPRPLQKILESKKYLARKRLKIRVLNTFVIIVRGVEVP